MKDLQKRLNELYKRLTEQKEKLKYYCDKDHYYKNSKLITNYLYTNEINEISQNIANTYININQTKMKLMNQKGEM